MTFELPYGERLDESVLDPWLRSEPFPNLVWGMHSPKSHVAVVRFDPFGQVIADHDWEEFAFDQYTFRFEAENAGRLLELRIGDAKLAVRSDEPAFQPPVPAAVHRLLVELTDVPAQEPQAAVGIPVQYGYLVLSPQDWAHAAGDSWLLLHGALRMRSGRATFPKPGLADLITSYELMTGAVDLSEPQTATPDGPAAWLQSLLQADMRELARMYEHLTITG